MVDVSAGASYYAGLYARIFKSLFPFLEKEKLCPALKSCARLCQKLPKRKAAPGSVKSCKQEKLCPALSKAECQKLLQEKLCQALSKFANNRPIGSRYQPKLPHRKSLRGNIFCERCVWLRISREILNFSNFPKAGRLCLLTSRCRGLRCVSRALTQDCASA